MLHSVSRVAALAAIMFAIGAVFFAGGLVAHDLIHRHGHTPAVTVLLLNRR
jgi:uncharacterized membrane protein YgdD (TMEM256/DUF423 family)